MGALFIFHRTERVAMAGWISTLRKWIVAVVLAKSKILGQTSTRPGMSFSHTLQKMPISIFLQMAIRVMVCLIFLWLIVRMEKIRSIILVQQLIPQEMILGCISSSRTADFSPPIARE